jgi:hypothetical protein
MSTIRELLPNLRNKEKVTSDTCPLTQGGVYASMRSIEKDGKVRNRLCLVDESVSPESHSLVKKEVLNEYNDWRVIS